MSIATAHCVISGSVRNRCNTLFASAISLVAPQPEHRSACASAAEVEAVTESLLACSPDFQLSVIFVRIGSRPMSTGLPQALLVARPSCPHSNLQRDRCPQANREDERIQAP